jgi:hypothetical protein
MCTLFLLLFSHLSVHSQITFNATGVGKNGTIQQYVVPPCVTQLIIDAYGAQGGNTNGGLGARIKGTVNVSFGDTVYIVVGQQGTVNGCGGSDASSGGGGGSFIWKNSGPNRTLLLVAGGGGGGNTNWGGTCVVGIEASTGTSGTQGNGITSALGGTGGNGGFGNAPSGTGSGGAGWLTNGQNSTYGTGCTGGLTYPFFTGGNGSNNFGITGQGDGGFGGGGGAVCGNGGGGGYSGGGGGEGSICRAGGGGGGSYNSGINQVNQAAAQTGNGNVTITPIFGSPFTVGANITPNNTICAGTLVTVTGNNANNYSWSNGVVNGTPFIPAASTTLQLVGTNLQGCTDTLLVDITVVLLPTINAGSDQTICAGTPVTLSASGTGNYSWNNNVQNDVGFTPTTTATYTVTGTDANNCSSSDEVIVTVNQLPTVNAGADQSICSGTQIILSGSGASNYSWNNNVQNDVGFTPTTSATYTVTGTDANNCSSSDEIIVTVNQPTSATQSQTALDTYTWPVNGQTFTQSGTYTATIPNAAGCDSTISLNLTLSFTGIYEVNENTITLFPNPAENMLHVKSSAILKGELKVFDMNGRILITQLLIGTESILYLDKLSKGSYLLQLDEGKPIQFQKN